MEEKRLAVKQDGNWIYDIVINDSFEKLADELKKFGIDKRKLCIVTETGVAPHYLAKVEALLSKECSRLEHFIFEQGEEHKNLETVSGLYEFLIEKKFDRKDMLLALGGGVTGDLTGFTAATYLRGIDFVQIPTSLLSQVDSSIGGKTGVDYQAYKNMVGAFYMPKLVYINIDTLSTLDDIQYKSGLGEVIKHGLIHDKDYFNYILENREKIALRDRETLAFLVEGSCLVKRAVVEEDPKEQGVRATLNFGHTVGHAIEKMMNFEMTHGECVGTGSVVAAYMSYRRNFISEKDYRDIQDIYTYFGFEEVPGHLEQAEILEAMKHDKKMEHGIIKFILLSKMGKAEIYRDVTDEEIIYALDNYQKLGGSDETLA